jgi:hypothetical protein
MDREPYKMEPHRFDTMIAGKQMCSRCGLMRLNNKFTDWAVKKGCNNDDHPDYARMRKLTNPFN